MKEYCIYIYYLEKIGDLGDWLEEKEEEKD